MSSTSKKALELFSRALQRWPKDTLRPDCQLQDVLAKRMATGEVLPPSLFARSAGAKAEAEMRQVNALYALLGNRYSLKYKLSDKIMRPRSNPTYYTDLLVEIEEAPNRTWFNRIAKKFGGMFRLR
ncbi:hypothetical protein B0H67DRAFT_598340 [Lasiosphaeris hirsuta]|uniref:Uncharacterized protein n=1 Tax=Lasiosphaeris hirsuta TaxID=260670 RepID=A0AA40E4M1_9PEZI|nr:hypothetical protein B0H67DRAFT_598340 [Lasiosphaeris hirsuta]